MEKKLRRQDVPPRPGPEVEVIRVEKGPGVAVQIVSKKIWGVWTHWDGRRSRECTGEGLLCVGHSNNWPQRWKGYLHVWCPHRKQFCFLECTPAMAGEIIRLCGSDGNLRGMLLRASRHGNSIRAKVNVELTSSHNGGATLPEEQSPETVLRKLWGWEEKSDVVIDPLDTAALAKWEEEQHRPHEENGNGLKDLR